MRPATCTQVTSAPPPVFSHRALRSFSTEALSSAALTNVPGLYQRLCTFPSTGDLLEWTLNTFMNTLILSESRPRYGSFAASTATILPSAGETTVSAPPGTSRAGSRKNCSTNSAANQSGADHHPANQVTTAAAATAAARKGHPSRAMT